MGMQVCVHSSSCTTSRLAYICFNTVLKDLKAITRKKVVHISLQQGEGTCQKHLALSTAFYTSLSAFGKVPPYL